MANPSLPLPQSHCATLLLFLLITAANIGVSSTTTFQEHETMLEALRNHGYTLFTNAITTSDLQYQLLTTTATEASDADAILPFTLFAPKDALVFSLDMATNADEYVNTLRYHVIPHHRHTFADLQNLASSFLDTLLPHYSVLIGKVQDGDVLFHNASVGVIVDGVRISHPDLFIGSRTVVHGIDGILVTGLNMNQLFEGNNTGPGIFSPVESPVALSGLDRNIPAEGTLTPMPDQFNWNSIPAAPVSPFDRNIPAAAPPVISQQDQAEKVHNLRKQKRGRHHRRRRGHRRHRGLRGHRLDAL